MATYQTLDYLQDLSATEMSAAGILSFAPASSNSVGWDYSAAVAGSESYALLHDTYRFTAKEGATYTIASTSYFDPFLLKIYDKSGNTIVANDESDDGADFRLSDGYYSNDIIFDWKAPYTGDYYVSASWNQGSYHKFYSLIVNEDIDTVIVNSNTPPIGTVIISGTATQGQTLTTSNTLTDADGLGTISYQWKANGTTISGATGPSLTLAQAQVGKSITVTASYTDGQGTLESVTSVATAAIVNVNHAPNGGVTITGTATQGQTLAASNTLTDADGLGTISYQWKANGTTISGATGPSLTLAQAQVGKSITVTASYTDGQGTLETVTSASTTPIARVDDVPISKFDNFTVVELGSPNVMGSGQGNDTYLLSPNLLPAGITSTITDSMGSNSIQLAPGLSIASSKVASTALQLTLSNGSVINVLGADEFSYEAGGNASAGLNQPDVSYATFVQQTLGVAVPSNSSVATGNAVVVGGSAVASPVAGSKLDNFVVVELASPKVMGSGAGNDTYLLSPNLLPAGIISTITDSMGSNSIQLAPGLSIASSKVASTALQLTLSNGSMINVLGADEFSYEAGGNTSANLNQADISYATFVQQTLGVALPSNGSVATGGAVVVGGSNNGEQQIVLPIGVITSVAAGPSAETFYLDAVTASSTVADTQITLSGFATASDVLRLDLPTASGSTTLGQLNGLQDVLIQVNPINASTVVSLGHDADGQVIALILQGVIDPALVQVEVV